MSKRIQLLRNMKQFYMDELMTLSLSSDRYKKVCGIITNIHKRMKGRRKPKPIQESMFCDYTISFKVGKKEVSKVVQATTRNNAEFAIKKLYGEKTQISSIQ